MVVNKEKTYLDPVLMSLAAWTEACGEELSLSGKDNFIWSKGSKLPLMLKKVEIDVKISNAVWQTKFGNKITIDRRSSCYCMIQFVLQNIKLSNEHLLLSNSNLDEFVGNMKEVIKLLAFNW